MNLIFLLLFYINWTVANFCDPANFRNVVHPKNDDYMIYGITQDCQMFFIRPSQLHLLGDIRIDKKHSFCFSNLVQLHLKDFDTLLLTFKQAHNRICTLEVHIPSIDMLFGDHLFRYSLLNSLRYASCSHSKDSSIQLEPDLTFMDPLYKDVIYFVDALSNGPTWKVIQFSLKEAGNLNIMNNLTLLNSFESKDAPASEFLMTIDAQKDNIYKRNKFDDNIDVQCGYDMLFNSNRSKIKHIRTPSRGYGSQVNAQAIEGDLMIYVETDQMTNPPSTRLNIIDVTKPEEIFCLVSTSFAYEVGIIREETLKNVKNKPLPLFGFKQSNDVKAKIMMSKQKSYQKLVKNQSSTPTAPTTIMNSPTPTVYRQKGAYSPSKSFFSYETTTNAIVEEEMNAEVDEDTRSNEISVEREIQEQQNDEEFNEIIKELKNDDIGELKTSETTIRQVNMTEASHDSSGFNNLTSSDQAAVKQGSRKYLNVFVIFIFAYSFN